jgi:prepilin-type processing-associated H-X9-DG protein
VMPGYAFNRQLAGKSVSKVSSPGRTPAIFESSLGTPNASDSLESFVTPHQGKGTVGFADGSTERVEQAPPAGIGGK